MRCRILEDASAESAESAEEEDEPEPDDVWLQDEEPEPELLVSVGRAVPPVVLAIVVLATVVGVVRVVLAGVENTLFSMLVILILVHGFEKRAIGGREGREGGGRGGRGPCFSACIFRRTRELE